jgi:hypothetical protein
MCPLLTNMSYVVICELHTSPYLCSGVEAVSLFLACVTKLCMSSEIISEIAQVLDMSHFCNINLTPNKHTTSPLFKTVVDEVFYVHGMKPIKYVIYVYLEGTVR